MMKYTANSNQDLQVLIELLELHNSLVHALRPLGRLVVPFERLKLIGVTEFSKGEYDMRA